MSPGLAIYGAQQRPLRNPSQVCDHRSFLRDLDLGLPGYQRRVEDPLAE